MDLPVEVWAIMFSYLHPNDLIEISATCKLFYHLSRKNELFIRKMENVKKLFKDCKVCLHAVMIYLLISLIWFVSVWKSMVLMKIISLWQKVLWWINCFIQYYLFVSVIIYFSVKGANIPHGCAIVVQWCTLNMEEFLIILIRICIYN